MACKRSSVRPRYSPLSSQEEEIFDILTHKTVSKDFKLKTECFNNNSQFTAESMSYKELKNYRIEELKTSIFQSFNFSILLIWRKKVRASGGCLGSRRR